MPLPIPAQRVIRPNAAGLERKAMRQNIAISEKQGALLDMKIAGADDAAKAAAAKAQRLADKNTREKTKAAQDADLYATKLIAEASFAAVLANNDGASNEDSTMAFYTSLVSSGYPKEGVEDLIAQYDRDGNGIFDEKELKALKTFAISKGQEFGGGDPTTKMKNAAAAGLKPGTSAYNDYILGTGDDGKPLAIEVKLALAKEVMNKTGEYEGISDADQEAYMKGLGMQAGPKGSVTLSWDNAEDMANSIIDKTDIGENWIGNNDDDFITNLTFALLRLAKDGRYAGAELNERALVDALGGNYDDLVELSEETGKTMAELLQILAQEAKAK